MLIGILQRTTLQARLALLAVLIALPGFISVWYHASSQRQQAIEQAKQQASNTAAQLITTQTSIISKTQHFLANLAEASAVKNPSEARCGLFLKSILVLNKDYINIGVPRADGQLLCNALPLTRDINVADRPYFQAAIKQQRFSVGTYQLDRASHRTSVNFASPVLDRQGQVVGAAVAVVSLDWWSKQLSALPLSSGTQAAVFDAQGTTIAHYPEQQQALQIPHGLAIDQAPQLILDQDGQKRVYLYQALHSRQGKAELGMLIAIPVDQPLASANQSFLFQLALFCGFMLIVTLLAVRYLRLSVVEPLHQLGLSTQALEEGRLQHYYKSSGTLEVDQLLERFQSMSVARLSAENTAKQRSEELDLAFSALPDGYLRIDEQGKILDCRGYQHGNNQPAQLIGQSLWQVLPETASGIFAQQLKMLFNETPSNSWEYSLENPPRFFEARANLIPDTQQCIIVLRDISKRKQFEQTNQLSALVYQNSSECMVITDPSGEILTTNPAFTRMTGYTAEEVVGKRISLLSSGMQDKSFYQAMWAAINQSGKWEGEIINRRKNGELLPEWVTIDTVYNSDQSARCRVALYRDLTEQKNASRKIWYQANFDGLTGLPNRALLYDRLNQQLKHARNPEQATALLFIDIDLFKEVNDTLGHDCGDLLLQEIAARLELCIRDSDTVARQGGDEFAVVLSELDSKHTAELIAQRMIDSIAQPVTLGLEQVYVTASIGIALYPSDGEDTSSLMKAADQAMYAAKASGRNCWRGFQSAMQVAALKRMEMVNDLRVALDQQQFSVHLQPITCLRSGQMRKAEALIRWQHPEHGNIPPGDFIPVAEESRQIVEMGNWVFNHCCQILDDMRSQVPDNFQISVNVSPLQLANPGLDIHQWRDRLTQLALDPASIVLEITEGVMMEANQRSLERLVWLRENGLQIALDDFGTGYSSMAYIHEYNIDFIKIDRTFVSDLAEGSDSQALCQAIIMMAHQLGLKVIAEGVETEQQRDLLRQADCDYIQGYLYSKPLPVNEFIEYLKAQCYT